MRKWQELILNSLLNFSMALVAGGILKLVLDKSSVIGSVIIAFCGAYLFVFLLFLALNLIRRDNGFGSLDGGWYHYRAYFFWIMDAKC